MKTQVISFSCILKNRLGHVLAESIQSEVVNRVGANGQFEDLARGLQNVSPGERRRIEVRAERAYGFYDPDLLGELPRRTLSKGRKLSVGDTVKLYSPEQKLSKMFRVIGATPEVVRVDGNHPLAGQDLIFEVEILEARELQSSEEVSSWLSSTARTLH